MATCNLEMCQRVIGKLETNCSGIPDDELKLKMVQRKFTGYKESLDTQGFQCDKCLCLPMMQLVARIEEVVFDGGEHEQ